MSTKAPKSGQSFISRRVSFRTKIFFNFQDGGWGIQVIKARPEIASPQAQAQATAGIVKRPKGFTPAKASLSFEIVTDDDDDDEPQVVVPLKHPAAATKRRSNAATVISDDNDDADDIEAGKDQEDEPEPEPEPVTRFTTKSTQRKKPSTNSGQKRK